MECACYFLKRVPLGLRPEVPALFVRGQAPQNSKLAEYRGVCPQDFAPPILSFAVPDPCW